MKIGTPPGFRLHPAVVGADRAIRRTDRVEIVDGVTVTHISLDAIACPCGGVHHPDDHAPFRLVVNPHSRFGDVVGVPCEIAAERRRHRGLTYSVPPFNTCLHEPEFRQRLIRDLEDQLILIADGAGHREWDERFDAEVAAEARARRTWLQRALDWLRAA